MIQHKILSNGSIKQWYAADAAANSQPDAKLVLLGGKGGQNAKWRQNEGENCEQEDHTAGSKYS